LCWPAAVRNTAAARYRRRLRSLVIQRETQRETYDGKTGRAPVGCTGGGLLASGLLTNTSIAAAPAGCDVRLTVELTPDVPDPTDEAFLDSLLSNQVDYRLSLREERSDSLLVVELVGPGPAYRCRDAIQAIRRDGRVLSVHVHKGAS
jgi:hypothetical protein